MSQPKAKLGAAAVPARHARVVPSVVAARITRPLEGRTGPVWRHELVRWERLHELGDAERAQLREQVVARMRPRGPWWLQQPTGVRLPQPQVWRTQLAKDEVARVEALLAQLPDTPLEELTIGQCRRAWRKPLHVVLATLADIEGLTWVPPARAHAPVPDTAPATIDHEQLEELWSRVQAIRWLDQVSPQDLRFGYPGTALRQWLTEQLGRGEPAAHVVQLLTRLERAERMTALEEARDVIAAAGRECLPRGATQAVQSAAAARWPMLVEQRYFSPTGAGRTLQVVGEAHKLTRERVRQICEAYERVLRESQVATPALERALAAAARMAPASTQEINQQLGHAFGAGAGIESLIEWTTALGRPQPLQLQTGKVRVNTRLVRATVLERADAQPWIQPLTRLVGRDCLMFGCSNIVRAAGLLALRERLAPGQEALEAALEAMDAFRWLDRASGWFELGNSAGSSLATRVRKMMVVAQASISADDIAAAIAGDDQLIYREETSLGLATPPAHVIREMLRGWPWLRAVQRGRFVPTEAFTADGVLTESEALAVRVIEQHGGIACRFEIYDALHETLGLSNVAVSVITMNSPIFVRIELGLFGLVGRRVGDSALPLARARLRARTQPEAESRGFEADRFSCRVTEAALRNEQYHVPVGIVEQLAGAVKPVRDEAGRHLGMARISRSGALSGLNRLFPAVKPGCRFNVRVTEDGLVASLETPPGASG